MRGEDRVVRSCGGLGNVDQRVHNLARNVEEIGGVGYGVHSHVERLEWVVDGDDLEDVSHVLVSVGTVNVAEAIGPHLEVFALDGDTGDEDHVGRIFDPNTD